MPEDDRVPEYLNPFQQIAQFEQKKFSDRVAELVAPLEATIAERTQSMEKWRAQAECAADARSLAVGEVASMRVVLAEQKSVNNDLAFKCGTLMTERDEARRFAEKAAQKYNELLTEKRVLRCAFCSFEYPEGTPPTQSEILTEHIRECDSHPFRMEIAGLKWEVSHCRELLRHLVAVAYKSRLSNEMELALSSVNNYLAGVPKTEVES